MRLCCRVLENLGMEARRAAACASMAHPMSHFCADCCEKGLAERFSLSRGTSERLRFSKPPMAAI